MGESNPMGNHEGFGRDPPSGEEIRAQLNRILTSADFDAPERAHKFLQYIVTETLAGRSDRIKAYSIALEVFGRDASFDSQSDPVVRIEAGRVRRALERYYLTAGSSDPIVLTIPKGHYVAVFSRRTEERKSDSAEPQPAPSPKPAYFRGQHRIRSLAPWFLAVIVVVVALAMLQWLIFPRTASGPNIPKLLVDPFENITGTPDGAIIARGLTVEIVRRLARFKDLIVIPIDPRKSDSAGSAPKTDSAIRYVLAGSLRIEGDNIRLLVQLIDRIDGSILWTDSYDASRNVRGLLDIEADIARDVATTLGRPYGIIFQADTARLSRHPPEDWEAYACTLSYYSYRLTLDKPTHASVKQCLERTVQQYPNYASAWALLSLMYLDELRFHYYAREAAPPEIDQAIDAASRSAALDPTNVRALEAQMIGLYFKNDVEAALKVGERAMALNPNDTGLLGEYGVRLALSGEWTRGCPLIAEALERNQGPLGYFETVLALCSYMQRDYQKAALWIEMADLQNNPLYHFVAAAIYGQVGNATAAERERQWILAIAPGLLKDILRELPMRIKAPSDREHFLDGLKRANFQLPES